jgi:hypothetical protein
MSAPAIDPDTPLRLEQALAEAYPQGGMTLAGLRREIARKNLQAEKVAGKHFTTLNFIEKMRERLRTCPDVPSLPASGSAQRNEKPEKSSGTQRGSSSIEENNSALAAARARTSKLRKLSSDTSAKSTPPPENNVTYLRSGSRT